MASTTTGSTSPPLLLVKSFSSMETREASSRSEPRVASPMTLGDDSDNEADSAAAVSISNLSDLTPDLWAKVLGYARYEDCLRAFTIRKGFLRDVIPRVKEIAVFDGRALLVRPARHFTGVKSVVIACLFLLVRRPDRCAPSTGEARRQRVRHFHRGGHECHDGPRFLRARTSRKG